MLVLIGIWRRDILGLLGFERARSEHDGACLEEVLPLGVHCLQGVHPEWNWQDLNTLPRRYNLPSRNTRPPPANDRFAYDGLFCFGPCICHICGFRCGHNQGTDATAKERQERNLGGNKSVVLKYNGTVRKGNINHPLLLHKNWYLKLNEFDKTTAVSE